MKKLIDRVHFFFSMMALLLKVVCKADAICCNVFWFNRKEVRNVVGFASGTPEDVACLYRHALNEHFIAKIEECEEEDDA